jgi:hypothetical protein
MKRSLAGRHMTVIQCVVWTLFALSYTYALVTMGGCGAAVSRPQGIPAGQWRSRLPQSTTTGPWAEARGGGSVDDHPRAAPARPDLSAYLKPSSRPTAAEPTPAKRPHVAPAPLATPEPQRATDAPAPAAVAAAATTYDVQRYAHRDATATKQQQFKAGDVVVISATTVLIVVLVVLLLVLVVR